jgi:hypothetical protein
MIPSKDIRLMAKRLNITVDEEIFEFVVSQGGQNRSAFVNDVLVEYKKRQFEKELIRQMAEDDTDLQLKDELKAWDATLWDGLASETQNDDFTI